MKRGKKTVAAPAPQRPQVELEAALIAAVRAHIERLRTLPLSEVAARAHAIGAELACRGDAVLFQTKDTDEVMALYAEALACLALGPDGIEAMGVSFGSLPAPPEPPEPAPACSPVATAEPAPQGQLALFGGAP